ncbi:chemotaxis protein CheA [Acidithiobacillus sp. AMEEHan]|uniref:chemotaxis protein CheA n=1 Tax=Acidithiobacillus sp. AMEEHan TaxID=2994951 RepID=UPI0027E5942C|nr:chemotaxis protein CheA [Acidithiobacillus sp. AMEEHan]
MSMDPEILQDYLPEARELLEQAQNDALALESEPGNDALLASLFRAFHTLKGGAGFLEAQALVDWTHHLEDLLDKLRSHALPVTSPRIDAILRGMDVIDGMLQEMQQGMLPSPGPEDLGRLIQSLADSTAAEPETPAAPSPEASRTTPAAESSSPDPSATGRILLTQEANPAGEQKLFVEQVESPTPKAKPCASPTGGDADTITETEFEQYLDQLYAGKAPGYTEPTAPSSREEHDTRATSSSSSVPKPAETAQKIPNRQAPQPNSAQTTAGSGGTGAAESTLRVEAVRLDDVMNQVGELVLLRNRYAAAIAALGTDDENLTRIAREMDLTVNDLQTSVMRLRMQPCKRLFQQLPRVVRDASKNLAKSVRLELVGEDVEIDKTVVDALSGPMTHLVRNSLDHGIEPPEERQASGKAAEAVLRVAAIHLGDRVRIEVSDDGRGIDRQKIVQKAIEKGVITSSEAAHLSEQEALELIFRPGFSTKEVATELSGRGVGMDVVRETVRSLRGRLEIDTKVGQGTRIAMEFPLTLAVLPVLYVRLRRDTYAMPISAIENLLDVNPAKIHRLGSRVLYRVDAKTVVPLIDLGATLQDRALRIGTEPVEGVLTSRGLLLLSEVLGNEDSVVKPVDFLGDQHWYQGATISGQGKVVLILDPQSLIQDGLDRQLHGTEVA